MTTHVRVADACPHCGGPVTLTLTAAPPPADGPALALIVDPASAALTAAPPSQDTNPAGTAAVPEDHAS